MTVKMTFIQVHSRAKTDSNPNHMPIHWGGAETTTFSGERPRIP
jgi:hypothetical protein